MVTREEAHALAVSDDYGDRQKAASLRITPTDDLITLSQESYYAIAMRAWANPKLPRARILEGIAIIRDGRQTWGIVNGLPRNPTLTSDDIRLIPVPQVYTHKNYPHDLMVMVAEHGTQNQRLHLAPSKYLIQEAQDLLARDPRAAVRVKFAKNRKTSLRTLFIMMEDPSPAVLRNLLGHPLAGPYHERILARLTEDNRGSHTTAAIARYTTDETIIAAGVKDDDPLIYTNALKNTAAKIEHLEPAIYSHDKRKRDIAKKNKACPEHLQIAAALIDS